MSSRSIPTDDEFFRMFPTDETCTQYLLDAGVFFNNMVCQNCHKPMKLSIQQEKWRCNGNKCNKKISIRQKSFFSRSHLSCKTILNIARKWLNNESVTSTINSTGCAKQTITNFFHDFRQLVSDHPHHEDYIIGGEDIIVKVDESKISKRKYHRGHHVEGAWLLGGVERTAERKVFLVEVPDRRAETLLTELGRYIKPGSIVYSDMFSSYFKISETLPFSHLSVNHSKEYVRLIEEEAEDGWILVTKIHTNTIEGTWAGLKLAIPKRNRTKNIEEHLFEFIWRRKNKKILWKALIAALKSNMYQ